MKRAMTPSNLIDRLEQAVKESKTTEERAKREAQLAGARAMNELWLGYRRRWQNSNRDKVRAYNREYSKKHRGKNEMLNYVELTVVERKIMEDVDNMK